MKKYELLLFDLDDTLIDFTKDEKLAFKYALENIGRGYSDDILEKYKNINDIVWKDLEIGKIKTVSELYEKRCNMFFEIYNIKEKPEKFNKLLDEGFQKSGTLFSDVEHILEKLKIIYK